MAGAAVQWSTTLGHLSITSGKTGTAGGATTKLSHTAAGNAKVTAVIEGVSATTKEIIFTAPPPDPEKIASIELDTKTLTITMGKTGKLTAAMLPLTALDFSVLVSSADEGIATAIATAGTDPSTAEIEITPHSIGATRITVQTVDGAKEDYCDVIVEASAEISVTGVTVDKPAFTLKMGETTDITATIEPPDATNTQIVSVKSRGGAVQIVDTTPGPTPNVTIFKVMGSAPGAAPFSVRTADGGFIATSNINVVTPAIGVDLDVTEKTLKVGEFFTITATARPTAVTNAEMTNALSPEGIAKVTSTGTGPKPNTRIFTILGQAAGVTEFTVTTVDGGFKAVCKITVESVEVVTLTAGKNPISPSGWDPSVITLKYTKDGAPVDRAAVKWETTGGELKNAVSTTNPSGIATASLVSSVVGPISVKGTANGTISDSGIINCVISKATKDVPKK